MSLPLAIRRTMQLARPRQVLCSPSLHRTPLFAQTRPSISRSYATSTVEAPEHLSEGERKIFDKIKEELTPEKLDVQDISGGCGSMYALDIVSAQFQGLPVIKQHRLVNRVLGEEIKGWHGVQLKTKAP